MAILNSLIPFSTTSPLTRRLASLVRRSVTIHTRLKHTHHVCVIGSGPAGFYVAQHLLKLRPEIRVDLYERLPVPFGLVRYGVAPDHPEVKNVINSFNGVLRNERVKFVGNVEVGGRGVGLGGLVSCYHGVVLCYGATSDRLLNIENEHLITSAREFVGWYNGLPSNSNLDVDLEHTKKVVIIGHGNVALDIGRILLTDLERLRNSDIADYALRGLEKSGVEEVVIVGRRGALHVSFTIKEFREMVKLGGVSWRVEGGGLDGVDLGGLPRPRKRLTELIVKSSEQNVENPKGKHWTLKFLRSPVGVRELDGGRLSVKFEVNRVEGEKAVGTGVFEEIECDVVFRSVGYRGVKVFDELPFDEVGGVVVNQGGRVKEGIYCSGWAGQGPRGVILSTMQHAFDVAKLVVGDIENGVIGGEVKEGFEGMREVLEGMDYTSYEDYKRIAEWEVEHGRKITRVDEMMRVCKGGR